MKDYADSQAVDTYQVATARDLVQGRVTSGRVDTKTAVAKTVAELLTARDKSVGGRVLVVEPHSKALGEAIRDAGRDAGVTAECWAMFERPTLQSAPHAQAFDRVLVHSWRAGSNSPGAETSAPASPKRGGKPGGADARGQGHPSAGGAWHAPVDLDGAGTFDVVVTYDLARTVPASQLPTVLARLGSFASLHGYLLVCEPSPPLEIAELEAAACGGGLLLMRDAQLIESDWTRTFLVFQRRSSDECRRIAVLRSVTWDDIHDSPALQHGLTTVYQEVFGGEEWREWRRCSRPECGRQYSRGEVESLSPPDRCTCGAEDTLEPYHTRESILANLKAELASREASRCYIRPGDPESEVLATPVQGFAWGYLEYPGALAERLLASERPDARARMRHAIERLAEPASDARQALVYYHSELGVEVTTRSLSLTRGLFQRTLEFAARAGAQIVVLRTSTRSSVYRLLTGLGMRIVFRTPDRVIGATDELIPQERVILGGDIGVLLRIFRNDSDRRLAVRIAHGLRSG